MEHADLFVAKALATLPPHSQQTLMRSVHELFVFEFMIEGMQLLEARMHADLRSDRIRALAHVFTLSRAHSRT